jgi:hypothetical protein
MDHRARMASVPDDWSWDPTLYAGSAPFYRLGRVPYPAALTDRLAEALALDSTVTRHGVAVASRDSSTGSTDPRRRPSSPRTRATSAAGTTPRPTTSAA